MIEVVYCMRRKPGLSHEAFVAHWESVHAPIVMANLDALRLARYERMVPLQHAFSERVERRRVMQPPFDGVARLVWATEEDMRHAFESDEALAVQRLLARDEASFVDPASSCRWVGRTDRHV
jgi:uncharacterized protein (TIGR02118 family)